MTDEHVEDDRDSEEVRPRIDEALKSLPLLDGDLYLGMQAMNLEIVDAMLEGEESDLLAEYIHLERTPVPIVLRVSALSQMWIFAAYELLRTWRERVTEVLSFGDRVSSLPRSERETAVKAHETTLSDAGFVPHREEYRRCVEDSAFREVLREALYRSDLPFRRIEALRVHLAKHEVPKSKGVYGAGAGYSRINYDGSIAFHIPLGGNEVDVVTRRQIADDLRTLADQTHLCVLPLAIQATVKTFSPFGYGLKRVKLTTVAGDDHEAVIAWDKHVVFVRGYGRSPFPGDAVVGATTMPEPQVADVPSDAT